MYINGNGVQKNLSKAKMWLTKAAEQGNAMAVEALKNLRIEA